MDLERFAGAAVLGAERVHAFDHAPELGRVAARVDPTVAGTRRAPQRDVRVAADEERHRRSGVGQILQRSSCTSSPWYSNQPPAISPRSTSTISSMRLPRRSHGTSIAAKSSGHGLMPTPSRRRSSVSTAMLAACLATSTTGRIASFSTNVVKRIVLVRAAR